MINIVVFSRTRCFAYNAKEIRVGHVPSGVVGKPVEFQSNIPPVNEVGGGGS